MRTKLKVILAAMGIAVLMSPVMAETRTHRDPSKTTGDTFPAVDDCVHKAFPQCSGGNWRRTTRIHHHKARVHKPEDQQ